MQLVAYGAQDIYLTGNPMITYFKVVYRRHTNFAMESIAQVFSGNPEFGQRVSALISRNGDLVSGMVLEATLPVVNVAPGDVGAANNVTASRWIDNVGHYLINTVTVEIGGQQIDQHFGDWLEIWYQLTIPAGQKAGYLRMIGQDPKDSLGQPTGLQNRDSTMANAGRKIYVPLQFWFCRNVGLALPLIALQYHEVKVNILFAASNKLLINVDTEEPGVAVVPVADPGIYALGSCALWVDYIYLDTDERRRFAQVSHEYLIEQLQTTSGTNYSVTGVGNTPVSVDLNFNHPVKELIWNCVSSTLNGAAVINQPNNYTTIAANITSAPLVNIVPSVTFTAAANNNVVGSTIALDYGVPGQGQALTAAAALAAAGAAAGAASNAIALASVTSAHNFTAPVTATAEGFNPVVSAVLQLNGQQRFASRAGSYFNMVQCKNHHTNIPESPGLNVYSFALKPEDHQPSGTCNFSRIDNARLSLTLAFPTLNAVGLNAGVVKVYAVNYNVLRIMSGMGGLAYSN